MTDFNFNLERSTYFNNRSKLLASNGVPKLSDAKANLGDSLAKVVFNKCEEALREDFGLKVPLNGPGDTLWISPSDLLMGKVALKPPFTPKCLQALTHEGILEVGRDLEKRFHQEMELDKQRTLEKYKAELLATVEDRMKSEIKDVEIRERLNCHLEMGKQQQEFDLILKYELDQLEVKMQLEYEYIISKNREQLKEEWQEKLQNEVKLAVENITKEFLVQLDEQEEKLTNAFQLELRKREILRDFDAKLNKSKMSEALKTLKHSLECKNLVNMMYILCTERRKCCEKKREIEDYYKKIISDLEKKVKHQESQIKKLTEEKDHQLQEVDIREKCLREVIKHFQKFINFALRTAPTQAEFLLSVEKMMVFELTNLVAESQFPDAQTKQNFIPWDSDSKTNTSSVMSNLEISDYHNCFNELNPPTPDDQSEIGEDRLLPAIYFKDKTYIREDFRDMLSTGIEIRPSNEIWNKDVEILIESWRNQSVDADQNKQFNDAESASISTENSVQETQENVSINNQERRRSKQSTVQFIETELVRSFDSKKPSRKSSLRPATFPLTLPIEHLIEPVTTTMSSSNILAAKDSIELVIEQKQRSGMYLETENENIEKISYTSTENKKLFNAETGSRKSKELVVETRDSVMLRKTSLAKKKSSAEFNISPKDSIEVAKDTLDKGYEVKSRPSKLISARNSVDILRESLLKLREPAMVCQKRDQHQSTLSPALGFADTCCEQCKRKEIANILSDVEEHKDESKILKQDSLSDERSVKISRIQVINLDDHMKTQSVVSFHSKPKIYASESSLYSDVPIIMSDDALHDRKSEKPKSYVNKLKIVGDRHGVEGEQLQDEFTADRIHSLIGLMKDHPQLLQLFTAGSR